MVKPKWKHVEQHRDDCGDDLSQASKPHTTMMTFSTTTVSISTTMMTLFLTTVKGVRWSMNSSLMYFPSGSVQCLLIIVHSCMEAMLKQCPTTWMQFGCMSMEAAYHSRGQHSTENCIDVIELFGGDGLTMFLAAKHHGLRTGSQF